MPFCTLLHLFHRPSGTRSTILTFTLAHGVLEVRWLPASVPVRAKAAWLWTPCPQGHTLKPLHTKGGTKWSQHSSLRDAFAPKMQHKFSSKEKIYKWVSNKLETREGTQEYFPEKTSCITTLKWKLSYFWRLASLEIHTSIFIAHPIFILSK